MNFSNDEQCQSSGMSLPNLAFQLPEWISAWFSTHGSRIIANQPGHAGYMQMVIELSRLNFQQDAPETHGGPFAAAVVHKPSGKVLSLGVNQVVPLHTSIAHAEIMAIAGAQQQLRRFSLADPHHANERPYTLYTSAQMCAMCLGAVCWSGVGEVVYGAQAEDTERLTGFDEGPIHPQWREELESRHIKVIGPVLSEQASAVLQEYKRLNKIVYNS